MANTVIFREGAPMRPEIKHDNGFLGKFAPREPTIEDRAKFFAWRQKWRDGQAANFLGLRDLPDALDAYEHFLDGKGKDRNFDYHRFVHGESFRVGSITVNTGDPSGKTVFLNARLVAREGAEKIYRDSYESKLKSGSSMPFSMSSNAIVVGGEDPRFPYPKTENWQKAIGGHSIWISANVTVTADKNNRLPTFVMFMTIHAEDRYNFNPGAADIATGIPDSANGLFEITGLATQYTQYATLPHIENWNGAPRMRPR